MSDYPVTLPEPHRSAYSATPGLKSERLGLEVGISRWRPRDPIASEQIDLTWILTDPEFLSWRYWYDSLGTTPFKMRITTGAGMHLRSCQFMGPPVAARAPGHVGWYVTASIEVADNPGAHGSYSSQFSLLLNDGRSKASVPAGDVPFAGSVGFAISFWLRLDDSEELGDIMGQWRYSLPDSDKLWSISSAGGRLLASVWDGADVATSEMIAGTIVDSNWHHFVWSYDGAAAAASRGAWYYDGLDVTGSNTDLPVGLPLGTTRAMALGHSDTGSVLAGVAGAIDQIAVWGAPLPHEEAFTVYNHGIPRELESLSPEHLWLLDVPSNDTLIDSVGGADATGGAYLSVGDFSEDRP